MIWADVDGSGSVRLDATRSDYDQWFVQKVTMTIQNGRLVPIPESDGANGIDVVIFAG
jgi:hypothetical protein